MKRSLIPEATIYDDDGDLEIRMGDVAVRMPIEDWLTSALLPKGLFRGAGLFDLLQAKQQRDHGWTASEVADYHGVSVRTVHRWFRRLGVPRSTPGPQHERDYAALRERACKMVAKGMLHRDIASVLGVHRSTVSQWTRRLAL